VQFEFRPIKSKIFLIKSNFLKRLFDNDHTKIILNLLLKDSKIVKDQASLIERIFEDEFTPLKFQLIKQAMEYKRKSRKSKIMNLVKMVK
jgi:hypothetical protein